MVNGQVKARIQADGNGEQARGTEAGAKELGMGLKVGQVNTGAGTGKSNAREQDTSTKARSKTIWGQTKTQTGYIHKTQ